jgi:hypothetical protein
MKNQSGRYESMEGYGMTKTLYENDNKILIGLNILNEDLLGHIIGTRGIKSHRKGHCTKHVVHTWYLI